MEYVWMWGVIAGVLAIVSAVLLSGRGAGLLAGYSTASAAERAHVNAPKLARTMEGRPSYALSTPLPLRSSSTRTPGAWWTERRSSSRAASVRSCP